MDGACISTEVAHTRVDRPSAQLIAKHEHSNASIRELEAESKINAMSTNSHCEVAGYSQR